MGREIKGRDLVVVGGGVIGCAVAREAARRGIPTTVVERGTPGTEATWAAAGMLTLLGEAPHPGAFLSLAGKSLELYPDFVRRLREESGVDARLRVRGKLLLAFDQEEEGILQDRLGWPAAAGLGVRWMDSTEIRREEPDLSTAVRSALRLEGDAAVDSRLLGRGAWKAAEAAGARFHLGTEATRVEVRHGRTVAVHLGDGTMLTAGAVVVAAGAWSSRLEGLPRVLPVRPVKGQLIALPSSGPASGRMLGGGGVYVVPQEGASGPRLVVGATMEEAGFDKDTVPEVLERLRAAAVRILPSLEKLPITEGWAGLRPGTPDGLPILGPDPEVEGLFYATGHFRNGILLTPVTAMLLGALLDGEMPELLAPFLVQRFAGGESGETLVHPAVEK